MATQRRSWTAVSVCWTLSSLLGFTPLFGWHNYPAIASDSTNTSSPSFNSPPCTFLSVISLPFMVYFNFLGCVMAPLLVMTLLYMQIFWSLQGRLKEGCPQAQASLLRERRLACSLALVLFLFAGCWIPLHLMNCLLLFHGPEAVTQGTVYTGRCLVLSFALVFFFIFMLIGLVCKVHLEALSSYVFTEYLPAVTVKSDSDKSISPGILLSHANSAINPVVYAYRIPKIQRAYGQIWRRFLMNINCCHGDQQAHRSRTGSRATNTETCGSGGRGHFKSNMSEV